MTQYDFDLFVIGAGSGGVRASRMSAGYGARVAVAEASDLGGTCVNLGCVPKKLMVYASSFSAAAEDAAGFGWTVPTPTFDWATLIANKDREIGRLNGIYRGLGRPFKSQIPGHDLSITSDEIFHLDRQPERIVIAGGGYIAVEFAGILNGMGSDVTLVYRGPLFLRGFDDDVRTTLAEEMRKRGITLRFDTLIEKIEQNGDGLSATTNHGDLIETDQILSAMGRRPNTAGLGLEEAGVELTDRGAVVVNEDLESSVSGIYAIGDCIDRVALTPVALAEGMAIAETIYNDNPTVVDYANIPSAVFSQPNIGTVGLTEAEARAEGYEVEIYRSTFRPMVHTLSGRDERTMMKLVVDRHMVGPDAGEIIQGMAVALKAGATKATFDSTIGIHPTAAEEFVTMRTPVG